MIRSTRASWFGKITYINVASCVDKTVGNNGKDAS